MGGGWEEDGSQRYRATHSSETEENERGEANATVLISYSIHLQWTIEYVVSPFSLFSGSLSTVFVSYENTDLRTQTIMRVLTTHTGRRRTPRATAGPLVI